MSLKQMIISSWTFYTRENRSLKHSDPSMIQSAWDIADSPQPETQAGPVDPGHHTGPGALSSLHLAARRHSSSPPLDRLSSFSQKECFSRRD